MDDDPKLSIVELIVLSLTVYTIFSIVLQLIISPSVEMIKLFTLFEWICSGFFMYEWFYRLLHSDNKVKFIRCNFFDFIGSLPITYLSGLKSLRLLRIVQIIKIFGNVDRFRKYLKVNKVYTLRLILVSLITLVMFVSPVLILYFEEGNDSSINTAEDAIWFSFAVITSCGFGDKTCYSIGGRLVTILMATGGIGLFSMFSGLVVNYVLSKESNEENEKI